MSTITIEESVTINRPADEVWRFLSDENNLIKWQQNLHSQRNGEKQEGGPRISSLGASSPYSPECVESRFSGVAQKGGCRHYQPPDADLFHLLLLSRCPESCRSRSAHHLHSLLGTE
jgi:Polyketide cyclase / dehydrase and lipid transport